MLEVTRAFTVVVCDTCRSRRVKAIVAASESGDALAKVLAYYSQPRFTFVSLARTLQLELDALDEYSREVVRDSADTVIVWAEDLPD